MSEISDYDDIIEEDIPLKVDDRVQVRGTQLYGTIVEVVIVRNRVSYKVKIDHSDDILTKARDRLWPTTIMSAPISNQLSNDFPRSGAVASTVAMNVETVSAVNNPDILQEHVYFANSNNSATVKNSRKNGKRKRKKNAEARSTASSEKDSSSSSDSSIEDDVNEAETTEINGLKWKHVEKIDEDTGFRCEDLPTSFLWQHVNRDLGDGIARTPLNYFSLMFPPESISTICRLTNEKMQANSKWKKLFPNEFLKYLGIRLAYSLQPVPGGIHRGGFGTVDEEDGIFLGGNFGQKFGMSRNRFQEIESNLIFANPTAEEKRAVSFYFH